MSILTSHNRSGSCETNGFRKGLLLGVWQAFDLTSASFPKFSKCHKGLTEPPAFLSFPDRDLRLLFEILHWDARPKTALDFLKRICCLFIKWKAVLFKEVNQMFLLLTVFFSVSFTNSNLIMHIQTWQNFWFIRNIADLRLCIPALWYFSGLLIYDYFCTFILLIRKYLN